jgi:demethylmenaquinone methyltransferase/2-methoxy-6-polyprenyl-1,4-benzoquinol methylase
MTDNYVTPAPGVIQQIFSNIAGRYDLLNFLLSFGLDRYWRRQAVLKSLKPTDEFLLDVGTGSGKLLKAFLKAHPMRQAVGIDFCEPLLEKAKKKLADYSEASFQKINLLEFQGGNEPFDIVAASFVLRSVADKLPEFFQKVRTLLAPEGRLVILELTRPENPILGALFQLYLKFYLPCLGRLLSGNALAYQFLSQSILHFHSREELAALMKTAGFSDVTVKLLSGGIATLFIASEP